MFTFERDLYGCPVTIMTNRKIRRGKLVRLQAGQLLFRQGWEFFHCPPIRSTGIRSRP